MNECLEEKMSKPNKKRLLAHLEVIKQEAAGVEKALQEHGGIIK